MRRGYLIVIFLLLTSIACGITSTASPVPTKTTRISEAASTQMPTRTLQSEITKTQTPMAGVTTSPTQEEPTKTPYPTSVLDDQMTQQINLIQSQVIQERGLQPSHPVPVVLLSPDELRQNVTNDFLADYTDEEIADDMIELSIIGLLDPGFDLAGFYTELLSEQVAGYYDNDMGEMFVVQGSGFGGPEHLTYAHEYTHVLQDQNYDIKKGLKYNDDTCDVDTERCAAIQALIEGDATLSEYTWFQFSASSEDQQQIIEYINAMKNPIYDSAPAFLKDDFIFAYSQGLDFVQSFYDQGGWSAVDAVYLDPPVSTEQILHPELYPSDTPIPVDLPDLTSALGEGWRELSRNQMGEWYTYLILARAANPEASLEDTAAQNAAAGWGGDEYLVLHNDSINASAFVMKTIWDTAKDAAEFAAALQRYANNRFGISANQEGDTLAWDYAGGYSSFYHSGDTTIWIIAPDVSMNQTISGAIRD